MSEEVFSTAARIVFLLPDIINHIFQFPASLYILQHEEEREDGKRVLLRIVFLLPTLKRDGDLE